jgi:hypothetical protein
MFLFITRGAQQEMDLCKYVLLLRVGRDNDRKITFQIEISNKKSLPGHDITQKFRFASPPLPKMGRG